MRTESQDLWFWAWLIAVSYAFGPLVMSLKGEILFLYLKFISFMWLVFLPFLIKDIIAFFKRKTFKGK